jgi:hypothetical protein
VTSSNWQQLKALSGQEWLLLLTATALLPLIALSLKTKGYQVTRARLEEFVPTKPNVGGIRDPQALARIVSIAANKSPYHANCLKKSLLLWWWLARRGIASEIQFGVNRDDGDFNAHAWVIIDGQVLLDTDDVTKRYTALNT